MGIFEREEELFERWAMNRSSFVRDGAVDEIAFCSASPTILFLLKEVNDPGANGGGWDLREFLRQVERGATWDNVARWSRGISDLSVDRSWFELSRVESAQRLEWLRSVAAMNLKKSPGGHTTIVRDFWQAITEDATFLREQFLIYEADIVVCCGSDVKQAFDAVLRSSDTGGWVTTKRGVSYLEYAENKHVIGYSHPEARVSDNLLYYGIVDAVREIWRNKSTV